MVQKILGVVLIVLGLAMILVDVSFTMEFMAWGLELHKTCPLPPGVCPFIDPPWQGYFLASVGIVLVAMGVYLYRSKPHPEQPRSMLGTKSTEETLGKLEGDEKAVYQLIAAGNGMLFQSKLIEKTGFTKVKISRILDAMEARGLLERRRRGMTNVVVLK